jgi:transposase
MDLWWKLRSMLASDLPPERPTTPHTHQTIETSKNYNNYCYGAMESWRWARNGAKAVIGNINFMIAFRLFQKNIEASSFRRF